MPFQGVYNVEEFTDLSWNAISYSVNMLYHFGFLQAIAVVSRSLFYFLSHRLITFFPIFFQPTEVNLNHMLCPAVLDPFEGQFYRIFAVFHQAILCPVLCKLFCCVSAFFLTIFRPTKVKATLCCEVVAPINGDPKVITNHPHTD